LSVVLDANALVVLALDSRRARSVELLLRGWHADGEDLHAPALLPYEIASALTRAAAAGQLPGSQVANAWEHIRGVPIVLHPLDDAPAVVAMAQRLERSSAYDAAYIVLAQQLDAELWTLDAPLARNAGARGLPVRLIETS
jgi:predicted nucleic acid-binding protein